MRKLFNCLFCNIGAEQLKVKAALLELFLSSDSSVKHLPVVTAEGSQAGDPGPAGRVRGGEERLPGHHPAAGEGRPAAARPAGAHGAPGASRLQLQQRGPAEEGGRVGRGERRLEAARRHRAENHAAFRFFAYDGNSTVAVTLESVRPVDAFWLL